MLCGRGFALDPVGSFLSLAGFGSATEQPAGMEWKRKRKKTHEHSSFVPTFCKKISPVKGASGVVFYRGFRI